jgi:hypothetical protein
MRNNFLALPEFLLPKNVRIRAPENSFYQNKEGLA